MGIRVANLDMGWFDFMGDWELNRSAGKFPNGEPDMIAFVERLHKEGFKSSFWWYPLGVAQKSRLARDHKDLLVQGEDGSYPLDNNDLYQLCPAYAPALEHLRRVLTRAVAVWGFDGAYTDYQGFVIGAGVLQPGASSSLAARLVRSLAAVVRNDSRDVAEVEDGFVARGVHLLAAAFAVQHAVLRSGERVGPA